MIFCLTGKSWIIPLLVTISIVVIVIMTIVIPIVIWRKIHKRNLDQGKFNFRL